MVNSIQAGSLYRNNAINAVKQTSQDDVKKLIKYTSGEAIKEVPDTFTKTTTGALKSCTLWEAIPFVGLLKNAKSAKETSAVVKTLKDMDTATKTSLKNIVTGKNGSLISRVKDYFETVNNNQQTYQALRNDTKHIAKVAKSAKRVFAIDKFLEKHPNNIIAKALKSIYTKKSAKVIENFAEVEMETNGRIAKIAGKLSNHSGKVGQIGDKIGSVGKVGKLGKFGKMIKSSGAGVMLALNAGIETFTEVVPTFKELGPKKGIKQVGKSTVKVVATTAGYVAGAKAGTAIGAAVGSIIPGVGTAIGSAIGFVGGLAGSFLAGKLAGKITGKSEMQKAKEEQEQALSKQIITQQDSLDALKQAAAAQVQAEVSANGKYSEDAMEINKILNKTEKVANATMNYTFANPSNSLLSSKAISGFKIPKVSI